LIARSAPIEEPAVGADHELGGDRRAVRAGGEVGDVALQAGQVPGLRLQLAVDALRRAVEGDEPVPLDRCQACDRLGWLGDLLVDAVQGAAGTVGLVAVDEVSNELQAHAFTVGRDVYVRGADGHWWTEIGDLDPNPTMTPDAA
jgi:hypothetical protein